MHALVLSFLATEHGPLIAGGVASGSMLLLLALWLINRSKLKRRKDEIANLESKAAILAKERDAAGAKAADLEKSYSGIIAVDQEIANRHASIAGLDLQIVELRSSYAQKRGIFDQLSREIAVFEDRIELAEIGMFRPLISLGSTEEYRRALESVRERQKAMISAKTALVCMKPWSVNGSEAQGRTMINRNIRMTLRAYNNECEVLINRVSWKNFDSIKTRRQSVGRLITTLTPSLSIDVTEAYEYLKFEELRLVYEEALKHQEEKNKIREEKEREREEAKAQRELQAEIARSEKRERQREEGFGRG